MRMGRIARRACFGLGLGLALGALSVGDVLAQAYDADGNPVEVAEDPSEPERVYDETGRVIAERHADGTVREFVYDEAGTQQLVVSPAEPIDPDAPAVVVERAAPLQATPTPAP